jgi:hypothetical protein
MPALLRSSVARVALEQVKISLLAVSSGFSLSRRAGLTLAVAISLLFSLEHDWWVSVAARLWRNQQKDGTFFFLPRLHTIIRGFGRNRATVAAELEI